MAEIINCKNRLFFRGDLIPLLLCFCIVASSKVFAAEAKPKLNPIDWKPPSHIQMFPMVVPVGHTNAPVTFFIEATENKRVEGICKRIPLMRDAILQILSRQPIPVKRRKIISEGVDQQLLGPINKALDYPYVKKIYIKPGVMKMGAGKIEGNPRATIDGCENILRSALARKQAEKAAKEK